MIQKLGSVIQKHPFFKGLSAKHLKFIAGCAKIERFEEGNRIFVEGDLADMFSFTHQARSPSKLRCRTSPLHRCKPWPGRYPGLVLGFAAGSLAL